MTTLRAVPDPDVPTSGLIGDTDAEKAAAFDLLLGVLIEEHVQAAISQCGGNGTQDQRDRLRHHAREMWLDRARTPEHIDPEIDRLRSVGRGEVAW